jgi:DNA-binding response OmpR family regulator
LPCRPRGGSTDAVPTWPRRPASESSSMARILIVEDDRPFADALAFAFRLEGHEVLVAATADEGVRIGLARPPHVIVADWMLRHHRHGGDVCQWIHAACPNARTIIITGCPDAVSRAARWCESAAAVLEKPFHVEEILQAVNQALSGRMLRRQTIRAMT